MVLSFAEFPTSIADVDWHRLIASSLEFLNGDQFFFLLFALPMLIWFLGRTILVDRDTLLARERAAFSWALLAYAGGDLIVRFQVWALKLFFTSTHIAAETNQIILLGARAMTAVGTLCFLRILSTALIGPRFWMIVGVLASIVTFLVLLSRS